MVKRAFWVDGIKYVVDEAKFVEYLRRLGRHGYASTISEFQGLRSDHKVSYLQGYRIYSGGDMRMFDNFGKPIKAPEVRGRDEIDIPLPV